MIDEYTYSELTDMHIMFAPAYGSTLQSALQEKVPAGGVGPGAVRGESVLVGGLQGCYWSKTV
jgi:hypothetical protein